MDFSFKISISINQIRYIKLALSQIQYKTYKVMQQSIIAMGWRKQIMPERAGELNPEIFHKQNSQLINYVLGDTNQKPETDIIKFEPSKDLSHEQNSVIKKCCEQPLVVLQGIFGSGKSRLISEYVKLLGLQKKKVIVGTKTRISNIGLLKKIIAIVNTSAKKQIQQFQSVIDNEESRKNELNFKKVGQKLSIKVLYYFDYFDSRLDERQYLQPLQKFYSYDQYLIRILSQQVNHNLIQIKQSVQWMRKGAFQYVDKTFKNAYYRAEMKILSQADIIVCSTNSAIFLNNRIIFLEKFYGYTKYRRDVAIIDQASQTTELDLKHFLQFHPNKLLISGDQMQLDLVFHRIQGQFGNTNPTIFTNELINHHQNAYIKLWRQYRMNPYISNFISLLFYNNQMESDEKTNEICSDIQYFRNTPFVFCNVDYEQRHVNHKIYNYGQICRISQLLQYFSPEALQHVAILTFYREQATILIQNFWQLIYRFKLTIKTIDGFQGQERDYIILSCVKSSRSGNLDFLSDKKRINVAFSRCRKGLVIVGNADTLKRERIWKNIISYIKQKNHYYIQSEQLKLKKYTGQYSTMKTKEDKMIQIIQELNPKMEDQNQEDQNEEQAEIKNLIAKNKQESHSLLEYINKMETKYSKYSISENLREKYKKLFIQQQKSIQLIASKLTKRLLFIQFFAALKQPNFRPFEYLLHLLAQISRVSKYRRFTDEQKQKITYHIIQFRLFEILKQLLENELK